MNYNEWLTKQFFLKRWLYQWRNYHGKCHRLGILNRDFGMVYFWKYSGQLIPTMGIFFGKGIGNNIEIGSIFDHGRGMEIRLDIINTLFKLCWNGKFALWLDGNIHLRLFGKTIFHPKLNR